MLYLFASFNTCNTKLCEMETIITSFYRLKEFKVTGPRPHSSKWGVTISLLQSFALPSTSLKTCPSRVNVVKSLMVGFWAPVVVEQGVLWAIVLP